MKTPYFALPLLMLLASCGMPPATDNLSYYKNPDSRIESIHVQAYNYDLGIGVPQDRKKANQLYLEAAKAGDPRSMMNYAINRYDGIGTDTDRVGAFYWIDRARFVTQNTPDMKTKWRIRGIYDSMLKTMTPDQIRQARSRQS